MEVFLWLALVLFLVVYPHILSGTSRALRESTNRGFAGRLADTVASAGDAIFVYALIATTTLLNVVSSLSQVRLCDPGSEVGPLCTVQKLLNSVGPESPTPSESQLLWHLQNTSEPMQALPNTLMDNSPKEERKKWTNWLKDYLDVLSSGLNQVEQRGVFNPLQKVESETMNLSKIRERSAQPHPGPSGPTGDPTPPKTAAPLKKKVVIKSPTQKLQKEPARQKRVTSTDNRTTPQGEANSNASNCEQVKPHDSIPVANTLVQTKLRDKSVSRPGSSAATQIVNQMRRSSRGTQTVRKRRDSSRDQKSVYTNSCTQTCETKPVHVSCSSQTASANATYNNACSQTASANATYNNACSQTVNANATYNNACSQTANANATYNNTCSQTSENLPVYTSACSQTVSSTNTNNATQTIQLVGSASTQTSLLSQSLECQENTENTASTSPEDLEKIVPQTKAEHRLVERVKLLECRLRLEDLRNKNWCKRMVHAEELVHSLQTQVCGLNSGLASLNCEPRKLSSHGAQGRQFENGQVCSLNSALSEMRSHQPPPEKHSDHKRRSKTEYPREPSPQSQRSVPMQAHMPAFSRELGTLIKQLRQEMKSQNEEKPSASETPSPPPPPPVDAESVLGTVSMESLEMVSSLSSVICNKSATKPDVKPVLEVIFKEKREMKIITTKSAASKTDSKKLEVMEKTSTPRKAATIAVAAATKTILPPRTATGKRVEASVHIEPESDALEAGGLMPPPTPGGTGDASPLHDHYPTPASSEADDSCSTSSISSDEDIDRRFVVAKASSSSTTRRLKTGPLRILNLDNTSTVLVTCIEDESN